MNGFRWRFSPTNQSIDLEKRNWFQIRKVCKMEEFPWASARKVSRTCRDFQSPFQGESQTLDMEAASNLRVHEWFGTVESQKSGHWHFHKFLFVNLRVLFFFNRWNIVGIASCWKNEHVHLMSLVVYASLTWYEGVVYPSCTGYVHVAISHEGKTSWQSGSLLWSRKLWAKLRNSIEPASWFQARTLTFWSFLNKKLWKASQTGTS